MAKIQLNPDALFTWLCNFLLAAIYLAFVQRFMEVFLQDHDLSTLLCVILESFVVILFLIRKPPKDVSVRKWDWFFALAGTFSTLFLIPEAIYLNSWLTAVQSFGLVLSILAVFSINRSFGLVPANRGVKTSGMYRYVRHPVYASYLISFLAFLFQHLTWYNASLISLHLGFQIMRIYREEAILMKDPAYLDYATKTRWRLVPGIW